LGWFTSTYWDSAPSRTPPQESLREHSSIPLRRIKTALDRLPENRTPTRRDWERLSTAWRHDLDDRINRLEHLRDRLSGCIGCGCLSLQLCKQVNPDEVLGRQGPGSRNL
jgi:MerR family redox-sensitive transcriptional activator SoxR